MRNLKVFFNPKSIALIGATDRPGSVGLGICKNLLEGSKKRKIFFVNPFKKKVLGRKTYPSVKAIREKVNLVVIAVPSKVVLKVVKECAEKKVGAAIVISAGFAETGKEGKILQEKVVNVLKKAGIPLLGPNCLGVIRPSSKLNATFAPATPGSGQVAFLSQSGALLDSVIDMALLENYRFSFLVSYGNQGDLDVCDFLELLKNDEKTKAIALYVEGLKDGEKFIKTAQKVTKEKPIIVLKAGVSQKGKRAISSHTASLAGDPQAYEAAFRKARVFQVNTLEELLDVSLALAWQPVCKNGIGVVTNGGACGVMISDWCEKMGVELTKLEEKIIKKLEKSKAMNPAFSRRNPLDIVGDALSDRYKLAIDTMLQQENIHGLIVVQTPQIMTESEKNAKVIIEARKKWKEKPIVACFLGGKLSMRGVELLRKARVPNIEEPKRAVLAIKSLIYYSKSKDRKQK